MSLAQPYYNLRNLRCTLINGVTLNLVSLKIKRHPLYARKWPGQAAVPSQVWIGEDLPDILAEVYNDDAVAYAALIPNVALDSFELLSPNDDDASFLQSDFFTKFPPAQMVFGEVETDLTGDHVSTVKIPIKGNVLNPGATGGFPAPDDGGGS